MTDPQRWPFPPATGPTPWTPAQIRAHKRQQAEQQRKDAPPAPW